MVLSSSDEILDKLLTDVGKEGYGHGLQLIEPDPCRSP